MYAIVQNLNLHYSSVETFIFYISETVLNNIQGVSFAIMHFLVFERTDEEYQKFRVKDEFLNARIHIDLIINFIF